MPNASIMSAWSSASVGGLVARAEGLPVASMLKGITKMSENVGVIDNNWVLQNIY